MNSNLRRLLPGLLALCLASSALAADAPASRNTTIELSAEAFRAAPNDFAVAVAYAEGSDTDPAALARRINAQLATALAVAKSTPSVSSRSGTVQTYPVSSKNGARIESWRMRSELILESRDIPALSALLGKLQDSLAVSQLTLQPAPETRMAAQDGATQDAIDAFRKRADVVAGSFGKRYRIVHLNIAPSGFAHPPIRALAKMEAAAMPIEAGDSQVQVNISGSIELLD